MKEERPTKSNRFSDHLDNTAFPIMKMPALRLGLVMGLIAFSSTQLLANVVITSPTGGNNLPADKALIRFTEEEGADSHCEPAAKGIRGERIFDWLDQHIPA